MSRLVALLLAGLTGISAAAAADLPGRMRDDGLPFVPLFAWGGTYVGVNAGYGTSGNTHRPSCLGPAGACPALFPLRTDRDGFVGGGQIGYNLQVGRFVGGIEADIQYADLGRAAVGPALAATQQLDYLGTVRARLGVAADRFLVYVTGGFAYGDVTARQVVQTAAPPAILAAGRTGIEPGYAAGGGIEYGLADNVTARAEALYYDLGTARVAATSPAAPGALAAGRFATEGVVARAALNYKFNLF